MPTILIVDDEPLELTVYREALEDEGYHLVTASNGKKAKKLLEEGIENLRTVLTDWVMPDVSGLDLLQWIKSNPDFSSVEVILQSGKIAPRDVQKAIDAGAYYYLAKPSQIPQLKAVVRAAVTNCESRLSLLDQIRKTEDAFKLMMNGHFELQTLQEAESLSVGIAATCATCQRALGLFELMINAVEHGNLGITYEEKSQLLESGRYEKEIIRRLVLPENQHKKVEVDVQRCPGSMEILIADQGPGFDYEKYLEFDTERLFDSHGRGIFLANSMLEIKYIDPGNKVRVCIPIRESEPQTSSLGAPAGI